MKKDPSPNWTAPGRNLPLPTDFGKKSGEESLTKMPGEPTGKFSRKKALKEFATFQSIANGVHGHGEAAPNRVELAHRVKEGESLKLHDTVAEGAQDLPLTLGAATPVHAQVIR